VDREIVARARAGDRDAFAALVRLVMPRLDTIARLTVRDPDAARDAVQEALVRAWRDLPSLRDPDRFEAWVRRLVVRSCIDELRRSRRRLRMEVELGDLEGPAIADAAADTADREALDRAFARLDPTQRATVVLFYYADLPVAEIGATLGLPVGTVKSTLSRGRSALRVALEADARGGLVVGEGAA
jgi:RNA polymerase sigma-70 factor (ECF subfamily)